MAIAFQTTEQVEQWICIELCNKLKHSSVADDFKGWNHGLAASSWQWTLWWHPVHEFLAKHEITKVTQPHYSQDLAPCDFWLFWKLKSPLKRKRFQTINEIQENMTRQLMAIGRTVWGPTLCHGTYFKGDWGIIVLCTMFLVSCIFSNKHLYFSYYVSWKRHDLLDRPHILANLIYVRKLMLHC